MLGDTALAGAVRAAGTVGIGEDLGRIRDPARASVMADLARVSTPEDPVTIITDAPHVSRVT
jgi:hypothetical protein